MTAPEPDDPSRPATRATLRRARARRAARIRGVFALVAILVLVGGGSAAIGAALTGPTVSDTAGTRLDAAPARTSAPPTATPVDEADAAASEAESTAAEPAGTALCDDPAVVGALAAGDETALLAAAGGAEALRTAIAAGAASCIPLDDAARTWVVVNKTRPLVPIDFTPTGMVAPEGVRALVQTSLRADAATALSSMAAAMAADGAGEIAIASAYRSYTTQQQTYAGHVNSKGADEADHVSARPGHSEHQTGLAADIAPCTAGSCATIDDLAASTQGAWIEQHAAEYGWIVRYEPGRTDVTGYAPEAWHLRFIGAELAAAYRDGGWTTLEEFFGLPAAPDYS